MSVHGTATATSTLNITVTAVNDAPVPAADTKTVNEDTPATGNVLTNDTDVDAGTTLTVTKFTIGGVEYTAGATATSDMLYSSNRVNKIVEGFPQNGGSDLSDLYGSTTKRVFIPNYIRMNTKSRSSSETRRNFFVDNEEDSRQLYPRRKIRLG